MSAVARAPEHRAAGAEQLGPAADAQPRGAAPRVGLAQRLGDPLGRRVDHRVALLRLARGRGGGLVAGARGAPGCRTRPARRRSSVLKRSRAGSAARRARGGRARAGSPTARRAARPRSRRTARGPPARARRRTRSARRYGDSDWTLCSSISRASLRAISTGRTSDLKARENVPSTSPASLDSRLRSTLIAATRSHAASMAAWPRPSGFRGRGAGRGSGRARAPTRQPTTAPSTAPRGSACPRGRRAIRRARTVAAVPAAHIAAATTSAWSERPRTSHGSTSAATPQITASSSAPEVQSGAITSPAVMPGAPSKPARAGVAGGRAEDQRAAEQRLGEQDGPGAERAEREARGPARRASGERGIRAGEADQPEERRQRTAATRNGRRRAAAAAGRPRARRRAAPRPGAGAGRASARP